MPPNSPRPPLTEHEQRLLTDPRYFAEVAAKGPVVLQDRSVAELDIREQRLAGLSLVGVDFEGTSFAATTFAQADLRDVTFTTCTFDDVRFEGSQLGHCGLDFGQLDRVRVADCTLVELTLQGCTWKDSVIERSQFSSLVDRGGNFVRSQLRAVRLAASELHGTRFDRTEVEDLTVAGGTVAGVTFSGAKGRGLLIQSALVDGLDFVLGTWVAVTFDQIRGRALRLTEVQATSVSLLGCGELVGVAVAGGGVAGLAIDRCPTLGLVAFSQVRIGSLLISDSFIDGAFWQRCTITDDSSIERTQLAGLDLSHGTVDGLTIRDSEFTVALGLEGASIQRLLLDRITYAPDLELRSDGISYGPGARFPTRKP
jgi:uncharacterized protein YjbI with pentapeptide repeats